MAETQSNPVAAQVLSPERARNLEQQALNYLREEMRLDRKQPIAVLLSGGVDSASSLKLLQLYGCKNIRAFYLKIWFEDDASFLGSCPWEEDLSYASKVAEDCGVPLHIIPMQDEYYRYVVAYTLAELKQGRTPSPDLYCNLYIKFGAFIQHIHKLAIYRERPPLIATGHYALLQRNLPSSLLDILEMGDAQSMLGSQYLGRAEDSVKDQSYFLSRLQQSQLRQLIFPLACLPKPCVRQLAQYWGLANAQRKDSQGICFLGKIKFRDFAAHYLGEKPGKIIDIDSGACLGEHRGLWFHTIGQRQGLGLAGGPWYVAAKDMQHNVLYIRHELSFASKNKSNSEQVQNKQEDIAGNSSFFVSSCNWQLPLEYIRKLCGSSGLLELKLRHGPKTIKCSLQLAADSLSELVQQRFPGEGAESSGAEHYNSGQLPEFPQQDSIADTGTELDERIWQVDMEEADRGIAPGQYAVFYYQGLCLGSGSIVMANQ